nr:hypothetical protein [Legionella jordanis]
MNKTSKINNYRWRGWDKSGNRCQGWIKAQNALEAKYQLFQQEIAVTKLSKKYFLWLNIHLKDSAVFSQQLATLLQAGIPLLASLRIMQKGQIKPAMKTLLISIQKDLENGYNLSESLAKQGNCFNDLYCGLLNAGEKAGALAMTLQHLAHYQEKIMETKRAIRKTLAYPLTVFFMAVLILIAMLIIVIPEFARIFQSFHAELPGITKQIIFLSEFCRLYGLYFLGFFFISFLIYCSLKQFSPGFSKRCDYWELKLPWLGSFRRKLLIAQLTQSLAITLPSGLPLIEALQLAAAAIENLTFKRVIDGIIRDISQGEPLSEAFKEGNVFPVMLIEMLAIAEESATLDQSFQKLTDYYKAEIEFNIQSLNTFLEPLIMSIIGLAIGIILLAMYVPIFRLGTVI